MKNISEFQVGNTWQLTNDPTRVFIELLNQHTRVLAIVFITGNQMEEFHLYTNLVGSKSANTCNKQYIIFFQMFLFLFSFFFNEWPPLQGVGQNSLSKTKLLVLSIAQSIKGKRDRDLPTWIIFRSSFVLIGKHSHFTYLTKVEGLEMRFTEVFDVDSKHLKLIGAF